MYSHSDNTTRPWTRQSHTISFTRPHTGLSRPGTAQATTTANSHYEAQPSFIIALLEGRGIAREVGMAALDRDTGRVMLIQVLLSPYTV
jgi:DNA mismatch repair protein MSH4